jgi:hypothetical protein
MDTPRKKLSVTEPKPLDPKDWLQIATHGDPSDRDPARQFKARRLHQQMATPRGRLDWLFAFGDRRARTQEEQERDHHQMAEDRDQDELACAVGLFMFMTGSGRLAPIAYYFVETANEELMRPVIRKLSIQVGEGIDALVDAKGSWNIQVNRPVTRTLTRVVSHDSESMRIGPTFDWWDSDSDDWAVPFLLAAANVVLAEAPSLRRCVGCGRAFVAEDPRERFHNKQCANKLRQANKRAQPVKPQPVRRSKSTKRKPGKVS